jgi:2-keto-4-pentenoate hydratase/2-oxohepta-3-ene-1,7-dioic acid hydratase in catechol pathway
VFAIGLNYAAHADETQRTVPDVPMVFTKFASSIAGAHDDVVLPRDTVDYEAELVVVIGQVTRHVAPGAAWAHVAGLTVGQDLSERELQTRPPAPQQYCLAKSFPGFAPIGPVLVTPGSLSDPDDLEIVCELNGQLVQRARTAQMIFSVADLVAYLSTIVTLLPGDLIFTGTPSGIGWSRTPRLCLSPGDELTTTIEGIGTMSQRMFGHG